MTKRKRSDAISEDNPEWTREDFAKARPAREVLSRYLKPETVAELLRPRGRPGLPDAKVAISLQLAPDVLERWKASGADWQTRMAESLRKHAPTHRGNP